MARKTPEVNSSSTADMAFLLLCFFMMTTTMEKDKGLVRRLPPMPDAKDQLKDQEINARNILQVKINQENKVLAASKSKSKRITKDNMNELGKMVKEFIQNKAMSPDLSDWTDTTINKKPYRISKGIISLQNDRGTTYHKYIEVQNELVKAFNEIRDEAASYLYGGRTFAELDADQQNTIKDIVPIMISEAEPREIDLNKK